MFIAVRSLATYIAIALYIVIVGAPMVLVTLVTRRPGPLYTVGLWGVRLGFALSGIRWKAAGLEHIQRDRAAVYAITIDSTIAADRKRKTWRVSRKRAVR